MSAAVAAAVRERVRRAAGNRCGYCLSRQEYVLGLLEVEHTIPRGRGGTGDEANLWLACSLCNVYKGVQTDAVDPRTGRRAKLFNPRTQAWARHFRWDDGGVLIAGRTAAGRATVVALQLNNPVPVAVRRNWIRAGWHPPRQRWAIR